MAANTLRTALCLLFFALSGALATPAISCKNNEGEAVDWFTFYKLPRMQSNEHTETGLDYLYLDSTMQSWRKSHHLMNSSRSVLGRTLQQLYDAYTSKSNRTAYIIYNDGVPTSMNYSRKYGHTKDSQLLVSQPNIYSCSIPTTFHWELIHIPQLCAKSSSTKIPRRSLAMLQSAQGLNFYHFAKSDTYTHDIFTAWMAPWLKTHLLAETWQRTTHEELHSNCSLPYHVHNVKVIHAPHNLYFSSTRDHSKWCVSTKDSKNRWVCIGDLNRSPSQAFRGGGFICTKNRYIYRSFYRLVSKYESCE